MITDDKIVKSIEAKQGSKGNYWVANWSDGKKDTIFNSEWLPMLVASQEKNIMLHITKDKSKDGKFWNVVNVERVLSKTTADAPVTRQVTQQATPPLKVVESVAPPISPVQNVVAQIPPPFIHPQEKGMWFKELGECIRAGLINKEDKGNGTYLWKVYIKQMLASLEIKLPKQEVKSRLVEQAKSMGAVVTDEEDVV